ncbi:thioredoxin [Spiroplasma tabanidicola]|uniref:Thioredoxin n=1 Tax=Spiroplasma tabanidicola TaxID=324079 RepID=A0A6I6C608_9MOLU|nr:thioredoxin [Spiroplasma tabanidicola]QGS51580.1 thioredoxin [Spiroplasma tabanidicola]
MAKIISSAEEFYSEIAKPNTVVDFYADWCGPCKMFAPLFDQVSQEASNSNFIKVNVDELREVADKYEIKSIPTVVKFENGNETNRNVGSLGKDALLDFAK